MQGASSKQILRSATVPLELQSFLGSQPACPQEAGFLQPFLPAFLGNHRSGRWNGSTLPSSGSAQKQAAARSPLLCSALSLPARALCRDWGYWAERDTQPVLKFLIVLEGKKIHRQIITKQCVPVITWTCSERHGSGRKCHHHACGGLGRPWEGDLEGGEGGFQAEEKEK